MPTQGVFEHKRISATAALQIVIARPAIDSVIAFSTEDEVIALTAENDIIAVVTNQESRGIDFNFGEGTLTLAASTAEAGQSKVDMPIAYSGPAISVTLDHRFVADFLKVLNPEQTVTIDIAALLAHAEPESDQGR